MGVVDAHCSLDVQQGMLKAYPQCLLRRIKCELMVMVVSFHFFDPVLE